MTEEILDEARNYFTAEQTAKLILEIEEVSFSKKDNF